MSYLYLASPYSHADKAVMDERHRLVCKKAAELMLMGKAVFCPIAHCHLIADFMGEAKRTDGDFWMGQDIPLLRGAATLAVLTLPGWRDSKGVAWEMDLAKRLLLPIWMIAP